MKALFAILLGLGYASAGTCDLPTKSLDTGTYFPTYTCLHGIAGKSSAPAIANYILPKAKAHLDSVLRDYATRGSVFDSGWIGTQIYQGVPNEPRLPCFRPYGAGSPTGNSCPAADFDTVIATESSARAAGSDAFHDSIPFYVKRRTGTAQGVGQGDDVVFSSVVAGDEAGSDYAKIGPHVIQMVGTSNRFRATYPSVANVDYRVNSNGNLTLTGFITGVMVGSTNDPVHTFDVTGDFGVTGDAQVLPSGSASPTCVTSAGVIKRWTSYPTTGSCP